MCIRFGGSITGEHGIGIEKRAFLGEMFRPDDVAMMREMCDLVDPKGLSNPGKMFPDGTAPSLVASGPHPLEVAGVISRE